MQRNVWAAPGIPCGGQIVGIGFALNHENGNGDGLSQSGLAGKPIGVRPSLEHLSSLWVGFCFFDDIVERIKH